MASPPFVRALEELLATARISPGSTHEKTPADAYRALLNNRTGMALCWPTTNAADGDVQRSAEALEIGCVEIPGSQDVYNATTKAWERRASGVVSVPLLGVAGRLGSITKQSRHAEGAFRLLAWLASRQWNERAVAASGETAPFRASQVAGAEAWSRGLRGRGQAVCRHGGGHVFSRGLPGRAADSGRRTIFAGFGRRRAASACGQGRPRRGAGGRGRAVSHDHGRVGRRSPAGGVSAVAGIVNGAAPRRVPRLGMRRLSGYADRPHDSTLYRSTGSGPHDRSRGGGHHAALLWPGQFSGRVEARRFARHGRRS